MDSRVRRIWRFRGPRCRPTRSLAFLGPMVITLLVLLVLALLGAFVLLLPRLLRVELGALRNQASAELAARNNDVDRQLRAVVETMDRRLGELDTKVDRRLETAGKTTTQIHERLGEVTKATAEMIDRAKDLGRLEQALRPPKARGGFGELLLENLLHDRLPPDAYDLQYTFSGDDLHRVPAGDRPRPQGNADRAQRAGRHGVLRRAADRLHPLP